MNTDKERGLGAREMATRLRAHSTLSEDPRTTPRTHIIFRQLTTACNFNSRVFSGLLFWHPQVLTHMSHTHTQAQTYTYICKINLKKRHTILYKFFYSRKCLDSLLDAEYWSLNLENLIFSALGPMHPYK